jgi:hypothetical protein
MAGHGNITQLLALFYFVAFCISSFSAAWGRMIRFLSVKRRWKKTIAILIGGDNE